MRFNPSPHYWDHNIFLHALSSKKEDYIMLPNSLGYLKVDNQKNDISLRPWCVEWFQTFVTLAYASTGYNVPIFEIALVWQFLYVCLSLTNNNYSCEMKLYQPIKEILSLFSQFMSHLLSIKYYGGCGLSNKAHH